MNIIRVISLILGVACVVLFIPPLISYRILNIGNATGLAIGGLLILYGIFARAVNGVVSGLWSRLPGRIILGVIAVVIIACIVIACIISILMLRAAGTKSTGEETLIVLGCQVKGTRPSLMLTERLQAAKTYMDEHEEAVCILSGGQGQDEGISEAQCMYNYLTEHGISADRLIMEDRSTSTRENFRYSLEIMEERKLSRNVAVVTNEFHEYRAFEIAKKLGIEPYAVPAHTHWWLFSTYFVREWYGVIYEWVGMKG